MKKIIIISITAVLLILNTGCNDWLDIRPDSETVLEDFWTNETEVKEVLAACYTALASAGSMEEIIVWSEMRSDNIVRGVGDMDDNMERILEFDIIPTNPYTNWGSLYYTINTCNTFLKYAPTVVDLDENFSDVDLHSLEAEVYAIRALAYFYLVRTFKDVPYITSASIDDNQEYRYEKSTEEYILGELVKDLINALKYANSNFGEDNNEYNKGRVTKNMIRALLADIYLWQEDYSNCIFYCDQIMEDEDLELVEAEELSYSVFFSGNSTESIFELQFDGSSLVNEKVGAYYGGGGNLEPLWAFPLRMVLGSGSPFEYVTDAGTEGEEDIRKDHFIIPGIDYYEINKYTGFAMPTVSGGYMYGSRGINSSNWIFYRLPDIILMKAEALIQMGGKLEEALELINITFLRANPDLSDSEKLDIANYSTESEMQKLLLRERHRELMFEGKRWYDLMRLARRDGNPLSLLQYVSQKFTSSSINTSKLSVMNALYLPINQAEIDRNDKLVQNPFYEVEDDGTITR